VPDARIAQTSVTQHQLAITGVGALNAGSITSGFGDINIGTNTFTGNGSGLTTLNATNLSSGTVAGARLGGNQTMAGIKTFSDTSQATSTSTGAVRVTGGVGIGGNLFVGGSLTANGANLTDLNADNLTTGTVPNARISGTYSGLTGTGALNAGSITSGFGNINIGTSTFTGNGSGLTTLNASNLASGTVPDARLSTNVVLLSGTQTITGAKTFDANLTLGSTAELFFGSNTRQMVNLWSNSYGIGVQSNTQYYRSANRFSWFRGGAHNNTENNPGVGGTVAMTLDSSSNLAVTGNVSATAFSGDGSALTGVTAGSLANSVTFNNSGGGAASGAAFNGAAGITVSWNTIGAVTVNNTNQSINGIKTFNRGLNSTSTTTGSVVISGSGGLGVGGNVNVGGIISTTQLDAFGDIFLTGTPTTVNQGRAIRFTGFDKEATADFSDTAYIQHTVNTLGHAGSVLVISSMNDADDGIAFETNGLSPLKHNSKNIPRMGVSNTPPGATNIVGDLWWDSNQGSLHIYYGTAWVEVNPNLNPGASPQFNSLGVGTPATGTPGEIRATNEITAYFSDARLKDFEGTIDNAIEKVKQLNGYYFRENKLAKTLGYSNDSRQVGVSAQEVQTVMPEIITKAPISDEYLTVKYEKMVPLLIEAIKEQQTMIEQLREEIEKLKGEV
jgi:hypothetical protein